MTSLLGLGVFAAVACGAPAQLDENLYPGPDDTGYADDEATGSTGTPLGGAGAGEQGASAGAGAPNNGSTGAPPAASGAGGGGSASAPAGGNGAAAPGGGAAAPGGGGTPAPGGGAAGGCPDDITVLFDRPLAEGGCNGAGCHIGGTDGTAPDLVSPNPESRLVDVMSGCNGRPYIGAGDSFLADKISGERPECGSPMPFLSADLLSDEDRQCILDWIDEVSGG